MIEWIRFKAYAKLLRIILLVRLGVPENKLTLAVSPAEATCLIELATELGWRAVIMRLLEQRSGA